MQRDLKSFLAKLSPRETRELAQDHVKKVTVDAAARTVVLVVDKRYAFNLIISHGHIQRILGGVKKAFGDSWGTIIQLEGSRTPSEREKALPHAIHYA